MSSRAKPGRLYVIIISVIILKDGMQPLLYKDRPITLNNGGHFRKSWPLYPWSFPKFRFAQPT